MKIYLHHLCTLAVIAISLCGLATQTDAQGTPGYKVLYSFGNVPSDGVRPSGNLIQDAAGNLYGTTEAGGVGDGIVFKVDTAGQETVLYTFCLGQGGSCTDGEGPLAGLTQDTDGNLYGTTEAGGANNNGGTAFKVNSSGQETILYSFCPNGDAGCTNGSGPSAGLIRDSSGNLYGTTPTSGANGGGAVFKLDTAGEETVLYSFCADISKCTDGDQPYAGLIQDASGNLYGTTAAGGANGNGTVFRLDKAGNETVLYSFCSVSGCKDGGAPFAGLIQDEAGNLYGTASGGGGGSSSGGGTVFKLSPPVQDGGAWIETVLYSFCSQGGTACTDGHFPVASLVRDAAGNLYGTTEFGGTSSNGEGTVFKVDTHGNETVLYDFCSQGGTNCTDGWLPTGGLLLSAGILYGTASQGGTYNDGTVFQIPTGSGGSASPAIALTSSLNPSYVGQSVTFSAMVSGSGAIPTGSVTFKQGTIVLGAAPLVDGQSNLATTFTKNESASIIASYSGDGNYKAKNSKALKQVVDQYATVTMMASSLNPSIFGDAITLSATVSSAGPAPTGTVTFKNQTTSLGSASLVGGVAKITNSTLPDGRFAITASYNGNSTSAKSTSPALMQVVDKSTSTTSVVSSLNPSTLGKTVKFTATVISPTAKPTGTVTFKDGSATLGMATLAGSGKASYSTSTLKSGSHKITAAYSGTANIGKSTSSILMQTVN